MQKAALLAPPCRSVLPDLARELEGRSAQAGSSVLISGPGRGRRPYRDMSERVAVCAVAADVTVAGADHLRRFRFDLAKRANDMSHGPAFASQQWAAICEAGVGHFHFLFGWVNFEIGR